MNNKKMLILIKINLNKKYKEKNNLTSLNKIPTPNPVILYPPKTSENFLKWSDGLGTTRFVKDVGQFTRIRIALLDKVIFLYIFY